MFTNNTNAKCQFEGHMYIRDWLRTNYLIEYFICVRCGHRKFKDRDNE